MVDAPPPEDADDGAPEPPSVVLSRPALLHCERSLELVIDLLSQLPTRRFVRTLLEDRAVLIKARLAQVMHHPGATLYRQVRMLPDLGAA